MTGAVLVLNEDYTALSLSTVNKAFLLIFLDKAELVHEVAGGELRTVNASYPRPSIIRLRRYVNFPYRGVELTRHNVFKRDEKRCQYCGEKGELTLDHVVPRSKGGPSNWANLITACRPCNSRKGNFTPEEAGMTLRRRPFKPSFLMFVREFSGVPDEQWLTYLGKKLA